VSELNTTDVLRRLDRLETKLEERIVYKDVYLAEKQAIHEAIGHAALIGAERDKALAADVQDLKDWRKTIYTLIAMAYLGLIGTIISFALNQAGGK
jgi:hypothetical protein